MLCYVMLCYVMLCYVMLCYVMLIKMFSTSTATAHAASKGFLAYKAPTMPCAHVASKAAVLKQGYAQSKYIDQEHVEASM